MPDPNPQAGAVPANPTPPQGGDNTPNPDAGAEAEKQQKIEEERKAAITEAIKNKQEARAAQEEATFYKDVASVQKDPERIIDLHETNPDYADQVSQEVFGKSYEQLLKDNTNQGDDKTPDVDKLVDEKLQKRDMEEFENKMAEAEAEFLEEKGIVIGSKEYEQMAKLYEEYSPASPEAAKNVLDMVHTKLFGKTTTNNDLGGAPAPLTPAAGGGGGENKPKAMTPAQKGLAASMGISEADFAKYSKK